MITGGIAIFMLDDGGGKGKEKEESTFGLILLFCSLALDSIIGPLQKKVQTDYKPLPKHMMYYTNAWSTLFLLIIMVVTGDGMEGLRYCARHPKIIYYIAAYSVTSAVGQTFIYLSLYYFGPLTTSLVTTTRKFFTILISVVYFGNTLSLMQWLGVAVVFVGLGTDIISGTFGKPKQKAQ